MRQYVGGTTLLQPSTGAAADRQGPPGALPRLSECLGEYDGGDVTLYLQRQEKLSIYDGDINVFLVDSVAAARAQLRLEFGSAGGCHTRLVSIPDAGIAVHIATPEVKASAYAVMNDPANSPQPGEVDGWPLAWSVAPGKPTEFEIPFPTYIAPTTGVAASYYSRWRRVPPFATKCEIVGNGDQTVWFCSFRQTPPLPGLNFDVPIVGTMSNADFVSGGLTVPEVSMGLPSTAWWWTVGLDTTVATGANRSGNVVFRGYA